MRSGSNITAIYSEELVRGMLRGTIGEATGGPLVVPDDGAPFLKFNGIRISQGEAGMLRVALVWDAMELGHYDVPAPDGGSVTLAGIGIAGRHPFTIPREGA